MYSVEWTHEALGQLTNLWLTLGSGERTHVTAAVDLLDRLLADAPLQQGESREGSRRVTFAAPLGISFRVNSLEQQVVVVAVWSLKTRST